MNHRTGVTFLYKQTIEFLKTKNIQFEQGLTDAEVEQTEKVYDIKLPSSLKNFLMTALPISKGFYNWRDVTEENVSEIRNAIALPRISIGKEPDQVYWCDEWGSEPDDREEFKAEVFKRLKEAPRLIPIFSHRYIPMNLSDDPPVISVCDWDVIYYGIHLEDYFMREFGEKKCDEIYFKDVEYIPFWTDIM